MTVWKVWKLDTPAFLGEGHVIRFRLNGGIFEGRIIGPHPEPVEGLMTTITAGPVKRLIGAQIKVKYCQVVAWQPLKARLIVHL